MNIKRHTNVFEKLLLLIGLTIAVVGFYLINIAFIQGGSIFDVNVLSALFLWFLLIFIMIMCAINENMREELGLISQEQIQEIKLLREISNEHLEEIKLLRADLKTKVPKKKIAKKR